MSLKIKNGYINKNIISKKISHKKSCKVDLFHQQAKLTEKSLKNIKKIFLIVSGKGGVGKSTVATQLAFALSKSGYKTGLLDVDICGPSIPRLIGREHANVRQNVHGWEPIVIQQDSLVAMSSSYLLDDPKKALIWKGPRLTSLIIQFLQKVIWGNIDYLIIDTPPGTSDIHISLAQNLSFCKVEAIIITTPQEVAIRDVRKCINFIRTVNIKIKGIIENMSCFICPYCQNETQIFSKTNNGMKKLCKEGQTKILGRIPIEHNLSSCAEQGLPFPFDNIGPVGIAFRTILSNISIQNLLSSDEDESF